MVAFFSRLIAHSSPSSSSSSSSSSSLSGRRKCLKACFATRVPSLRVVLLTVPGCDACIGGREVCQGEEPGTVTELADARLGDAPQRAFPEHDEVVRIELGQLGLRGTAGRVSRQTAANALEIRTDVLPSFPFCFRELGTTPNEDSAQVVRKSIPCKPEDGSCRLVQGMSEDGRGMVAVPARIRRRSPIIGTRSASWPGPDHFG